MLRAIRRAETRAAKTPTRSRLRERRHLGTDGERDVEGRFARRNCARVRSRYGFSRRTAPPGASGRAATAATASVAVTMNGSPTGIAQGMATTVLLADDHQLVVERLRAAFAREVGVRIVGGTRHGADVLALVDDPSRPPARIRLRSITQHLDLVP